jgi:hypothetical protein
MSNDSFNILFLCVNFDTYDLLDQFLNSINDAYSYYHEKNVKIDVLIADNSLVKQYVKLDHYTFSAKIISNENIGYFGAINELITKAVMDINIYDFCVISNVDIRISKSFFKDLLKNKIDNSIAWIAPAILSYRENRNRNPKMVKRPSFIKMKLFYYLYKYPLFNTLYTSIVFLLKNGRNGKKKQGEKLIYSGHGSFIILTNNFFKVYKNLYYPCFLFGEEIFLAELIRKVNLRVEYIPSIVIYDTDHASTSKLSKNDYCKYNYESIKYLMEAYFE